MTTIEYVAQFFFWGMCIFVFLMIILGTFFSPEVKDDDKEEKHM